MAVGALEVAEIDRRRPADGPRHLLFLDADLGATAANAGPLVDPVAAGDADMTVTAFAGRVSGGHGFVVRLAGSGSAFATGWTPAQPLNGQPLPHPGRVRGRCPARSPAASGWRRR